VPRQYLKANHVFINCPFDSTYRPIFEAIVFAIYNLSFIPRCSLEEDNSAHVRLHKIEKIIAQCRFGIHDISAVELDALGLPRFNMPLELGLFLGCKLFGPANQRKKSCLILDKERYRFQRFMSDIGGQDIHAQGGQPEKAIIEVRNWLQSESGARLASGNQVVARYLRFKRDLPEVCARLAIEPDELPYPDLSHAITEWLGVDR